jgi:hypothetical protein
MGRPNRRHGRRRCTTAIAVIAVALGAAACSGGDDDAAGDTVSSPADATESSDAAAATTPATTPAPTTSPATAPTTSTATTESSTTVTTTPPLPDPVAEVSGPIEGTPANAMPAAFATEFGYVEEEYFLSGSATSYAPMGELGADGRWDVTPADTADYTTRVIVRRPTDGFNGTVYVEWFNVTSGVDGDPDFGLLYPVVLDERAAYVAVSAQAVAIEGGEGLTLDIEGAPSDVLAPLKVRDPERYGALSHPGDAYSYDIYAQVAQLLRSGALLDGAGAELVVALGESQSAGRLVTFVNAVQPITDAYDGFLVHSRGGGGAPLADDPDQAANFVSGATLLRTDVEVPVLQFITETDLIGLGFLSARQDDTSHIVTWEVAGTAHADASLLAYGQLANAAADFDLSSICPDINDGPQSQVLRAGFAALGAWVRDGVPVPSAPRLEIAEAAIVRDGDGIALGGIRTPDVDAPIATHSGESEADSVICFLFGSTTPFTPERLAELYTDHAAYVAAVTESADAALAARHLLPADRDAFVAEAEAAAVPS